ncbi:MAG TPA: hypothetical protein VF815_26500 [Myxococcaceae bacterium]|jgi:hypothetical protein
MHSLALLVLCLLVGVPTVSYAQSEAAPPPPPDAPTLPPLVTAPEEPEEPAEEPPTGEIIPGERGYGDAPPDLVVPRMILSPALGGVAAGSGAIVGLILGAVISDCAIFDGCDGWPLVAPMLLTSWLTGSLTVYGMGRFLNGMGTLGPTMLGGALGTGLGVALLFASEGSAWYLAPLAPALAAAVAFEISNSFVRASLPPPRDIFAGIQVMPVVSATPAGGVLGGLVGRF